MNTQNRASAIVSQLEAICINATKGCRLPAEDAKAPTWAAGVLIDRHPTRHPWIPTEGEDAVTLRGFIYDVDNGKLEEVSYLGDKGSFG